MAYYTQAMAGDPAKWYAKKEANKLSQACQACKHHSKVQVATKDGLLHVRYCEVKNLKGNELAICEEFRPNQPKETK